MHLRSASGPEFKGGNPFPTTEAHARYIPCSLNTLCARTWQPGAWYIRL